jgi:sporulation protein YlmC with PRC-barrel domain
MNKASEIARESLAEGRSGHSNKALLLSATTLTGNEICNRYGEKLGHIRDFVLDMDNGRIRYAVMSCGGFLGMGDRLFAIPWSALDLDTEHKRFLLDVGIDRLKAAPGFDKDNWPNMADEQWAGKVRYHFRRLRDDSTSRL